LTGFGEARERRMEVVAALPHHRVIPAKAGIQ